jgi:hypothetical protein
LAANFWNQRWCAEFSSTAADVDTRSTTGDCAWAERCMAVAAPAPAAVPNNRRREIGVIEVPSR